MCDINTNYENIILICSKLLGIAPTNFKDIFKKLNKDVIEKDITEHVRHLTYKDKFNLEYNQGHAEFKLINNTFDIFKLFLDNGDITEEQNKELNLFKHWINLDSEDRMIFFMGQNLNDNDMLKNLPNKYSLEHFKYYIWKYPLFFVQLFDNELQTEEICLETIAPSKKIPDANENDIRKFYLKDNLMKIKNRTRRIYEKILEVYGEKEFINALKFILKKDEFYEGNDKILNEMQIMESLKPNLFEELLKEKDFLENKKFTLAYDKLKLKI
jgi:hypothetical protein